MIVRYVSDYLLRRKSISLVGITVKWDYKNKVVHVFNYIEKVPGMLENSLRC